MMLGIYLAALIVGGGLVVLAAIGGIADGHSVDHDGPDLGGDHGVEVGHGGAHGFSDAAHVDAALSSRLEPGSPELANDRPPRKRSQVLWRMILNVRFWTYFLAFFGLIGFLLTVLRFSIEPFTVLISLATGVLGGGGVAATWAALKRSESNSAVSATHLLGTMGPMIVACRPGEPGKVRLTVNGELIDMMAMSHSGESIERGTQVTVVDIDGMYARVTAVEEFLQENGLAP
jgi:membrane protein implicated in regulation of membrane protease activity